MFRVAWRLFPGVCAALCLAACGQTDSEAPAGPLAASDFYRGKTVSIIVGSGAGGGFDTTARLVARHIGAHIPGSPTVIVVNMPGGGGPTLTLRRSLPNRRSALIRWSRRPASLEETAMSCSCGKTVALDGLCRQARGNEV